MIGSYKMMQRQDLYTRTSDETIGSTQKVRTMDGSQRRPPAEEFRRLRSKTTGSAYETSQTCSTMSLTFQHMIHTHYRKPFAAVSIRTIVLVSMMSWWFSTLFSSTDRLHSCHSFPTHHPLLSISLIPMVQASTTTMSAFVHPRMKRMQLPFDRLMQQRSRMPSHRNSNNNNVGGYDPSEGISVSERIKEKSNVGNPQQVQTIEKEFSVTSILKELAAIQQQGPQKYCILGTRHCSYLHQQIIELLAYALVLSGNHVYTSGSSGTNAATIRGALRAERPDLLTVVLPQSLMKQTEESQQLLKQVKDVIEMPQNNDLSLDIASRICNSYLLSLTDQLISFAFHESTTVIEAAKEAKELDKLVTVLFLD